MMAEWTLLTNAERKRYWIESSAEAKEAADKEAGREAKLAQVREQAMQQTEGFISGGPGYSGAGPELLAGLKELGLMPRVEEFMQKMRGFSDGEGAEPSGA